MKVNALYKNGKIELPSSFSLNEDAEVVVVFPEKSKAPSSMPFIDLKAQQRRIYPQLVDRILTVLDHGQYILGPEVSELEEKLAHFVGVKHAITCSSGTDALLMPLMAYGIGPGDAIFTPPFTFIATAEVVSLLGATPVFVDIDPRTFNIDPDQLELAIEALQKKDPSIYPLPANYKELTPKGIIPVDLFGLPADYDPIMAIARKNDFFVLEDAAQSFGAEYKGKKAGSLANAAATSFFPAKPLGGFGDGGAIFTDDNVLAEKLLSIRVHGQGNDKYENLRIGLNGRLDTLQAAILLEKLEIFSDELLRRQHAAEQYNNHLNSLPFDIQTPYIPEGYKSAWAQYSLFSPHRSEIINHLKNAAIPTAIYYPIPLHLQKAFSNLAYKKNSFKSSESIGEKIFSLPMHPYLENSQIQHITDAFAK